VHIYHRVWYLHEWRVYCVYICVRSSGDRNVATVCIMCVCKSISGCGVWVPMCSPLECVVACCSVSQCVAVCCSALPYVAVRCVAVSIVSNTHFQ